MQSFVPRSRFRFVRIQHPCVARALDSLLSDAFRGFIHDRRGPQIVPLKRGQKSTNSTQGEKECPIPVLAHNFIIKYLKKHDVV